MVRKVFSRSSFGIIISGTLIFAGCSNDQIEITDLPDANLTEKQYLAEGQVSLMKTGGFKVELLDSYGMIFMPSTTGGYDLLGRFAPDDCLSSRCELLEHPTNRFTPFALCQYSGWLPPSGFEEQIVSGDVDITALWSVIDDIDDVPLVASRERADNAQMLTLYESQYNNDLIKAEAEVWRVCWDIDPSIFGPTIMTEGAVRTDCRNAKGELQIEAAKRELEAAKRANEAARRAFEEKLND